MEFLFNLLFLYSLQLGFYPMDSFLAYKDNIPMYTDFSIQFQYRITKDLNINLGGEARTYFYKDSNWAYFNPIRADYTFFFNIQLIKNIEIGYIHQCIHAVDAIKLFNINTKWTGQYDEVYIKIKGECQLF